MSGAPAPQMLPDGYSEVAAGKIAAVVTCLDMHARTMPRAEAAGPWRLEHVERAAPDWYRNLFRRVGNDWLWYSRLLMPQDRLEAILCSPDVEVYAVAVENRHEGLLELDFREPGTCELAFFGLTQRLQGQGAGRWLMNRALERAWHRPIERLWVHTCTLDHPGALAFYLRSGFKAYARRIEIADDPRLLGVTEVTAGPHIPIIAP